jgi:Histidine kinase-, DNA gyrase B-, and HSP90-like ATPase
MSLLLPIFWCAAGAVIVTVALTIVARFSPAISRWRLARYQRVVRGHLTAYVVGARDDAPPSPDGHFEQRVPRRDLVALVPSVKGEAAVRSPSTRTGCRSCEGTARGSLSSPTTSCRTRSSSRRRAARSRSAAARPTTTPVIEVSDTGIGIPADEIPRLFTRFYRVSSATQHAISGTGLGLAIVKWIADAHHGAMEVDSSAGAGTTMRLLLPLDAA